jgi:hypothetical protein
MIDELEDLLPYAIIDAMRAELSEASQNDNNTAAYLEHDSPDLFLLPCFAHTLQLAVKQGLNVCKIIDVAIDTFRDLPKKINDSLKFLEALKQICTSLKVDGRLPSLDVETRWNSTWEMIIVSSRCKKPIEKLQRRIRDRHDGFTNF